MGTQRFRDALHALVAEDLQGTRDLWPSVRKQVEKQPAVRRLIPIRSRGWAAVALVLALAFGTAAYAAITSILDRVANMDPSGSRYLVENGLVEMLSLSQTDGDVTATLEWAYADVNRIVIAYTVAHPADRENTSVTLSSEDGTVLPTIMGGYGYVEDGLMGDIGSYDASLLQRGPNPLRLHLHLEVSTFNLPDETPVPPPVTVDPDTGANIVALQSMEISEPTASFDFQFSVPLHPGREVTIGQTLENEGIGVTLERVVIAPSDTRFDLCFSGLDSGLDWIPVFNLHTPGVHIGDDSDILGGGRWLDGRCYRQDFGAPLGDQHGTWTLNVTEVVGDRPEVSQQARVKGPWGFRFQVP
jgi:hypothetical protein